ncbi:Avr1b-1 Avirulence-like protein [Phytophthora palmivora]|uniref:RxLR effector protein n=1 Tax=Phytophthora palmivora TaxID=4796 RepID=A0A2P4X0K5_9STRA|nr:Avr1b-1 Avirulence-like protein [Phytophthora palmivora]
MRLFNTSFVALAAVFLTSGTAVSKADQTNVSNVDIVHSSHGFGGEGKRFLRSHQTTDDEGKYPEEERNHDLFSALKLSDMQKDAIYRFKMFGRWKRHGYLPDAIRKDIPESLFEKYAAYRRIHD